MKDFIYQIEKEELEEGVLLKLYSVDNKYNTFVDEIETNYRICMKKDDFKRLKINSDNIIVSNKEFFNKNKEKVIEIEVKSREMYKYLLDECKGFEYETYESDLNYEHFYLINKEIGVSSLKENKLPKMKVLSIDIESVGEVEDQRIILLSTHSKLGFQVNRVYVNMEYIDEKWKEKVQSFKFEGFEPIYVKNEKELLEKFKEDVIEFSPQIIVGWNVIDFDFKVIKERMKAYSIEFKLSKFEGDTKMRIARDFFGRSNLSFPGILVFDSIALLKTNFIDFEDFKLNTVAREVLGDSKIDLEDQGEADFGISNKIEAIENMLKEDPIKLIEYNYKDSLLTTMILEKLNLIELMCSRSIITSTPLVKVQSPIASLDIMYLKELRKRGFVAPSNFNFSTSSPIEGAYVADPTQGFYNDVFVLDFKSLYPSIIMTFNIDPFTFNKKGQIEAPNGAKFEIESGILPELIKNLSALRDLAKQEKDSVKSFALKITMNSFYGAIASPKSRFYNKEIGEAITSFGREMMMELNKFIKGLDLKAIYNDTDSAFIVSSEKFKSFEEKKKFGLKLEKEINEHFKKWAENKKSSNPKLTIEFEKFFSKFFIASKKRYVGFDEFTHKTQFTGLEAVRGDWTQVAKTFQRELVELIFKDSNQEVLKKFIFDKINKLKNGDYGELLIYKKKITKPLEQYTKTTPPHVKAAREVENFSSKTVQYVMLESGPKHISLIGKNPKYDYDHYVHKQLKGVADDLLESLGLDFEEIVKSKTQKSLNSFFG